MKSIQPKRFLIIETYFWNPHVKRTLEIGKKIKSETTNEVEYALFLNSGLYENSIITTNSFIKKSLSIAKRTVQQIQLIFYLILNKFKFKIFFLNKLKFSEKCNTILSESMDNIKIARDCVNLRGKEIDQYSHGITSAIISRHRNENFDIKHDSKALKNLILETLAFTQILKKKINHSQITDIIVFNGRFCLSYASIKIAKDNNLDIHFHESSRSNWTYYLSTRKQFNTSEMSQYFDEVWINTKLTTTEKYEIGKKFFESSQNRNTDEFGLNRSFLKDYNETFSFEKYKNKKIISIFTSSDDEYFLFELDKSKKIGKQNDKIINCIKIIEKISNQYEDEVIILLRIHPNDTSDLSSKFKKVISSTELIIFDSDFKINSYDILNNSDLVFSYRTTVGVEGIYKRKPSIMLTDCVYWKQNVCFEGDTEKKLEQILNKFFLKKLKVSETQYKNSLKIGFGYFYGNGEYKYLNNKNGKLRY